MESLPQLVKGNALIWKCRVCENKKYSEEVESGKQLERKLNYETFLLLWKMLVRYKHPTLHFKDGLIYDEYLEDGDSTSHKVFIEAKSYAEYFIHHVKCECIFFLCECMGHVQKRLGTRLRNKI